MRNIFLILFLLFNFAFHNLYAVINDYSFNNIEILNTDSIVNDTSNLKSDNLKPAIDYGKVDSNEVIPLFSFVRSDFAIDSSIIYAWLFNDENHSLKRTNIDTSLNSFQIINPVYQKSISNSFLGNVGLANRSNIYSDRVDGDFIFINSYNNYLFKSNNIPYYNTKKPFTNISYKSGSKKEQILSLIHTQNINRYFNIAINYKLISSEGHYLRQKTTNNSLALSSSFIKNKYALHTNFIVNKINVFENGGIIDDYYLTDTTVNDKEVNVKLPESQTNFNEKNFTLIQQYFLDNNSKNNFISKLKASLFYKFNYNSDYKLYLDDKSPIYTDPVINDTSVFNYYQNTFNKSLTYDSVYYNKFTNTAGFKFGGNNSLGLNLFYTYLKSKYYYFNIDTLFNNSRSKNIENKFLTISIYNNVLSGLSFTITGNYYFEGYYKNNYLIEYELKKIFSNANKPTILSISGLYQNKRYDYFLNNFCSNHFKWNNNFNNKKENKIHLLYNDAYRKLKLGVNIEQTNNLVYFDKEAMPLQNNDVINIYSAFVDKKFTLKKFNLLNRIVYQYSDNDKVIPLPMISLYESLYYENLIKFNITHGKMFTQIGFDVYYNTKFYAPAYMPSLAQFYLQEEKQIGGYPYIDLFLNFKVKRARIFFKIQHINSGLIKREYFTVLHYPMNERSIKFGLSWSFYD